ncbi:MAG TPA: N(G),N(G)-dimethylarginine dimethylaminohydrolase [Gemmatimonadaceae bacterium]
MLVALIRTPSPKLEQGERTHIGRDAIDFTRALEQHQAYGRALAACGADVHRLDDAKDFADGVFIEDTAIVLPEVAVLTRPGATSRRGEVDGVANALARYRECRRIEGPATLDGGDVVVIGKTILVGRSQRTNVIGIAALQALLLEFGYVVVSVGMHGCLHLKSGCTALPDGRLLINPDWITIDDVSGFDLVPIPTEEPWGGDVAIAGGKVVAAAAHEKTLGLLAREGYDVVPVDVSEFAKAEGGVTCLSLIFESEQRRG